MSSHPANSRSHWNAAEQAFGGTLARTGIDLVPCTREIVTAGDWAIGWQFGFATFAVVEVRLRPRCR